MSSTPSPEILKEFIERGLAEDVGSGDITSIACIPERSRSTARLLVKEDGILAGVALAEAVFLEAAPGSILTLMLPDGSRVSKGQVAFEVEASTRDLLRCERLVLNAMQRMSGIATLTRRFMEQIDDLPARLLDTRKTTPGIRFLEKWAVHIGGGENYRYGLYDWFMIKDNHIAACGSVRAAIERVRDHQAQHGMHLNVTVEVKDLEELEEVLAIGHVTRIMFDNMDTALMAEAVRRVGGRFQTEASGGIRLENIRAVAMTGVDYISVGALTHSARAMDLSLKIAAKA